MEQRFLNLIAISRNGSLKYQTFVQQSFEVSKIFSHFINWIIILIQADDITASQTLELSATPTATPQKLELFQLSLSAYLSVIVYVYVFLSLSLALHVFLATVSLSAGMLSKPLPPLNIRSRAVMQLEQTGIADKYKV